MREVIESIDHDWRTFANLENMVNHWDRPDWRPGRVGYYWYVTFGSADDLRQLAAECQAEFAADRSFNLVPLSGLHMTLDRVAFEDEVSPAEINDVCEAGRRAATGLRPFQVKVGPLAGSSGAVSFTVTPFEAVDTVRRTFTAAARSAGLGRASERFRPHVGIAYSNAERPARPVVETVASLRTSPPVCTTITSVALVRLTRHERAYEWTVRESFPFDNSKAPGVGEG